MAKVALPTVIRELSDFNESTNILVYGDSGAGKTVLGGTCPDALFLSTEQGTISAKRQGSKARVWRIEKWEDLEAAYKWLRDNPNHPFKWIVLDSVTKMQEQLKRHVLDRRVERRGDTDPDIPEIADHQKFQNMFKRFMTAFVELPTNVLFTATTMRKEDEEGDDIVLPNIDGKGYGIANYACAEMDVVAYYGMAKDKSTKRTVRRLLCQHTPPYFAKDRFDVLGNWIDDPNMPDIIKLIESSGTEENKQHEKKSNAKASKSNDDDIDIDFDDGDDDIDF